jgi:hypothetical protein
MLETPKALSTQRVTNLKPPFFERGLLRALPGVDITMGNQQETIPPRGSNYRRSRVGFNHINGFLRDYM